MLHFTKYVLWFFVFFFYYNQTHLSLNTEDYEFEASLGYTVRQLPQTNRKQTRK